MRHSTNKMRKIIISTIVLIVCITIVSAIPPIPEDYQGYATLNGAPAPYGTSITVEVYDTGEEVGNTTVQYPDGDYSLDIIFDYPDTPKDEGANEGDKLTWKINGIDCSTPAPGTGTATPGGINSNFNLTATSADNPPSVTALHPNGGESIPIGTQVQVSAHATDDTAVTSVTFSYSNNSGSDWNPIGAGTRVSGTAKDGIWNRTWNTNSLDAGSNYMIRAVADDGIATREDQSDSTFSLTCTPPSAEFSDRYSDYGTDTDGNGLYDYLTIEIGVDVTTAGYYCVNGELGDSYGNYIEYRSNCTYLNTGNQTIQLDFSGVAIRQNEVNGTYDLKYLYLYDGDWNQLDFAYEAYTTSHYNYTDFGDSIPDAHPGDVNHDDGVTPADATIALELAATGGWDPTADMNHDSHITSLDALMILKAAAGAITL